MAKRSPTHKPTAETAAEVRALSSFGVPQEEIAAYLDIDPKTLRKYYNAELMRSRLKVHARVGSFLVNAATGAALKQDTGATYRDCLTAAIFYGKTRMGLKETTGIEHGGSVATTIDASALSSETMRDLLNARRSSSDE
jgi:hypothetical protein